MLQAISELVNKTGRNLKPLKAASVMECLLSITLVIWTVSLNQTCMQIKEISSQKVLLNAA